MASSAFFKSPLLQREKLKEQRCLYRVMKLSDDDRLSISDMLRQVVALLPVALLHADDACACIDWQGQHYGNAGALDSPWQLCCQEQIEDHSLRLTLAYGNPQPQADEGPFLAQERELLDTVARQLKKRIKYETAQQQLHVITEAAHGAIILLDPAGCIRFWNRAAEQLTGYRKAEALGRMVHELIAPQRYRETQQKSFAHFIATGQGGAIGRTVGLAALHRDDHEIPVAISLSAFKCADGWHSVGILRDISVQKRYEAELLAANQVKDDLLESLEHQVQLRTQALEQANREMNALFDSASVGLVLVRNRIVVRCNRSMEQIFGYEPGELTGRSMCCLYPDQTLCEQTGRIVAEQLATTGSYNSGPLQLLRKDGRRFWSRSQARVLDRSNPMAGLISCFEDISDDMAQREQLLAAKQAAETANQAKSTFVANMSHEIRTPMNAVLGMAHLALQTELSPTQRNYLEKIQSSGQHLLGILNQILDFAKVESGQLQLEQTPFQLSQILREVVTLNQTRAGQKGLRMRLDLAPDLPDRFVGDCLRIQQILLNYTDNAIKFSDRGEIVLQVRATKSDEGTDEVPTTETVAPIELLFRVCDQGMGLSAEQQNRLFQRFTQADMSTTRTHGGTGLGLAICKQLAECMGGRVGVESHAGQGSCFWFTARLSLPATTQTLATTAVPAAAAAPLQGRLLLVEDNPLNQEIALDLLESLGPQVDVASNGREALEKLEQGNYDLVLMDVQMPVMDGLEASRAIRQQARWRDLPILALTANAFEEDRHSCLAAGMNDHITKPVDLDQLYAALLRWLPLQPSTPRLADRPTASAGNATALPPALLLLEGFDAASGLRSVRQRPDRLLQLLQRFATEHCDDAQHILDALAAGDSAGARQLSHSLKGLCGTLGLVAAQDSASALDSLLRHKAAESTQGPDVVPAQALELAHQLRQQIGRACRLLQQLKPATAAAQPSPVPLDPAQLQQLRELLASDDVRAVKLHETLAPHLRQQAPQLADQLARQIADFAFDQALISLVALMSGEPT